MRYKKTKTAKYDWSRFALKLGQLKLRYVELFTVCIILHLLLITKSVLQTERLHDSSAVQRLEIGVQCTPHGGCFEPCMKRLINFAKLMKQLFWIKTILDKEWKYEFLFGRICLHAFWLMNINKYSIKLVNNDSNKLSRIL